MKRAVLYLRVSTLDQTTANQERELRQVAERASWQIVHVYKDHGISGAKGKDKRPQFDALHEAFKTWSASCRKSMPRGSIYSCISKASTFECDEVRGISGDFTRELFDAPCVLLSRYERST